MNIGLVGCGVIGTALKLWLIENTNHNVLVSDPYKNYNDDLSNVGVCFIQIHIPTDDDGTQSLEELETIIDGLPDVPIYIRTTVKPTTCSMLSEKLNKSVNFMPEFLTERTAEQDFNNQKLVFTNHIDTLKEVFPNKPYIIMTSTEAEVSKYVHNVFGALKVSYFNGVYDYCEKNECDYDNVLKGVLMSEYINETHTQVPGPDGKFGYGGKCFPKDVKALIDDSTGTKLNDMIKDLENINTLNRGKKNEV